MDAERKIERLLREHNFKLIREKKHLIYQDLSGRIFVIGATPSDFRAARAALTTLEKVIASPPKPMVIAISDFERQQAAEKIAGQQRPQQAAPGMGSGKQRRSNGTGFHYYDPNEPLTEEQRLQREQAAARARELAAQRRERKLQRRQERQAKRDEAQKQILLAHINEMLKQIQPTPRLSITVKLGRRNLFKSTVRNFADSFEKLRWQETEDEIEIIFGTKNNRAIARFTKLRNNTNNSFTVLNQRTLFDGTTMTEQRGCHNWTYFNEVRLPDGTHTVARIEYRDGNKEFNIKKLPDGTVTKERVERPDGGICFGLTVAPDGTQMAERVEFPDGEIHFDTTITPDGTKTVHIVRLPDGREEVDVEL